MDQLPETPFTGGDLEQLGLTYEGLRSLVRRNVVRQLLHGVYCRHDVPDTIELRAHAAARVLPAHVVVCDRTAAWLHGIDHFEAGAAASVPPLDVVSVGGHERTRRPGVIGGKRALLDEDLCTLADGVVATTPLRTACDLACLHGRTSALAVLDAFRRHHGLTVADFEQVLPRHARRRGVTQLRELVPLSTPLAESPAESWVRCLVHDDGLPPLTPQVEVWLDDIGLVRLDLAYRQWRIAVEYDGEEHHSSDLDRARDERRRAALRREGWIVIVVRRADLSVAGRATWLAELRAAVRDAQRPTRRRYARAERLSAYHR